MARVSGYTAEHLQKWIRSNRTITEEITFSGNIENVPTEIHSINVPESPVPVRVRASVILSITNTMANAELHVGLYETSNVLGSIAVKNNSADDIRNFSIPAGPSILVPADDDSYVIRCKGLLYSGSGFGKLFINGNIKHQMSLHLEPDWENF